MSFRCCPAWQTVVCRTVCKVERFALTTIKRIYIIICYRSNDASPSLSLCLLSTVVWVFILSMSGQRSFVDNVFTQQTAVSKREMKPQEISTRGTLYAQQHAASWMRCLQRSSWEQLSWRRAGSANQFAGTDAAGRQPRRGRGALTTVSK